MKLIINPLLCKSCVYCVKFCPKNVLEMGTERNKRGHFTPVVTDESKCTSCAICATMCPEGAIEVMKGDDE